MVENKLKVIPLVITAFVRLLWHSNGVDSIVSATRRLLLLIVLYKRTSISILLSTFPAAGLEGSHLLEYEVGRMDRATHTRTAERIKFVTIRGMDMPGVKNRGSAQLGANLPRLQLALSSILCLSSTSGPQNLVWETCTSKRESSELCC